MLSRFLQALGIPQDLPDEVCTDSISKVISLAASEQPHSVSIKDIHLAVAQYKFEAYLEPLDVLPVLLPCRHDGATDLLSLCAANNSPKEVMVVLQEAIEYVQSYLNDDEDGEEEQDPELVQRVIGIVLLCKPAISKSKLGKKSALELCSPILHNVTLLVSSVSALATRDQGRLLITEVANLVKCLSGWGPDVTDVSGMRELKHLLRELLDTTISTCASTIQASLAARAIEGGFARRLVTSSKDNGWKGGVDAMFAVQLALRVLGDSPNDIPCQPTSFADMVYLAHTPNTPPLSPSSRSDLSSLLVNALQMNIAIDEAMYLLYLDLSQDSMSVSPELVPSLCTVLTALASTHLDPTIRQLSLRLLSMTLSKLPPPQRLGILLALTTDEDFPQIRGPAVGLLKEPVLEALTLPADHVPRNPFASSELLRTFGGVLFRPNPPEFFGERKTREELTQSLELLRISDCLSFYYVLLHRDRDNRTGVRSKANVTSVQGSLLRPLQQFLDDHIGGEERPLMALSSLQIGLDRINNALRTLDLS